MQSLSTWMSFESLSNTLEKTPVTIMFTLTVFDILLLERRSVLSPSQRVTERERIKISVKDQKNVQRLLKLLEK